MSLPGATVCECGKRLIFGTKDAALEHKEKAKRSGKFFASVHRCEINPQYWHLTTHAYNAKDKLNLLAEELHTEVATIRETVVEYMEFWFIKSNKTKFTTSEVIDGVIRRMPQAKKNVVSAAVSGLKSGDNPVIIDLGPIPKAEGIGGARGKFIGLAKHNPPVVNKEEVKPVAEVAKTPVSAKLPTQVAPSNPFDKVFSQLGEALSKVDGLVKGYTEVVDRQRSHNELLQSVISKLDDSEVKLDPNDVQLIIEAVSKYNNQQTAVLKNEISIVEENTRETVIRAVEPVMVALTGMSDRMLKLKAPENFGTLTDDEKYRLGIKEGIKLAVEMGLMLPDA